MDQQRISRTPGYEAHSSSEMAHAGYVKRGRHGGAPSMRSNGSSGNLSAHAKLSQTQLSHISQNKASTMHLIQKIYAQMEKIDMHICSKERIDDARYTEMERRMRKLYKRYTKVKHDSKKVQRAYD